MEKAPKPFWQPVAVLDHPPSKKSFLLIRWDIMCLNLYPLPLALPLTITEKKLVSSPLLLRLLYVHTDKVPLSPLFFRLNSFSFLSLSLHVRCSNPSTIFLFVCWTHSSMPMALLYWGAQSWTQYSLIPKGFLNRLKHNNWPNFYDLITIFFKWYSMQCV